MPIGPPAQEPPVWRKGHALDYLTRTMPAELIVFSGKLQGNTLARGPCLVLVLATVEGGIWLVG